MYHRYNEFQRGLLILGDEERSGRPLTAVREEDVLVLKKLIQDDSELRIRRFNR